MPANAASDYFTSAFLGASSASPQNVVQSICSDMESLFRKWLAQQPSTRGGDVYTGQTISDYCTALRNWLEDPAFSALAIKTAFAFSEISGYLQFKADVESQPGYAGFNNAAVHGPGRLHAAMGKYQDFLQDGNVQKQIKIMKFVSPYLAAIRTKPFILLAGISGTGKSRMVRQLARGCCPRYVAGTTSDHPLYNEQNPGNFAIIPVRPNWHDSTELMGYESRIGTPEFVIKPFVEFLVKAWMNPDVPFFLCLDEMNLAPVEQYFAEYLSAIESRKAENGGGRDFFKTDVVVKIGLPEKQWEDNGTSVLHNALAKLFGPYKTSGTLDAWATYVRDLFTKDGGVSIPQNLVVMGTVNMDETTCSFSRKVLDRAMSFELNDVSDMYDPAKIAGEGDYEFGSIDMSAAKCELLTGKDAYDKNNADGKKILTYLEAVNKAMEGTQFKIAYRSRNEIMIYCYERTKGALVGLRQALDEATSMKILSRIEGDEQKFARFKLEDFRKTIVKGLLDVESSSVRDEDVKAFLDDDSKVASSPCASKLGHMIDELNAGAGFVSYWE